LRTRKILFGSLQLAGGQGATQLLSLARNLLIARLIGPEQFGLGLTFVLVVAFVEMAGDLSWQKFIVQDAEGDQPRTQATLHLFLAVRGLLLGAALLLGAEALIWVLGVSPELAWAYRLLALVPLLSSLTHLDMKRFHRQLRYGPDVAALCVGNVAGLVIGVAAAFTLNDYRALLIAVIVRYVGQLITSHMLAEWPFRFGYSRDVALRAWRFGWPLTINGVVLFASSQGDRAVVVRAFGLATFGVYGAVALVVQAVASLVSTVVGGLGLPLLAAKKRAPAEYELAYNRLGSLVALGAVSVCVPLFALLPSLLPVLYGDRFEIPRMLVALLIGVLLLMIFRSWPTVAALSLGATRIVMAQSVARSTGIALAAIIVALGGSILDLAAALLVGEVAATAVVFALLRSGHGLPVERAAALFAIVLAVGSGCLAVEWLWGGNWIAALTAYPALLAVGWAAMYVVSAEVRGFARGLGAVPQ
jgi:O-antigen/teichoic acid export membrane protein